MLYMCDLLDLQMGTMYLNRIGSHSHVSIDRHIGQDLMGTRQHIMFFNRWAWTAKVGT